jgi:hypothetical protein
MVVPGTRRRGIAMQTKSRFAVVMTIEEAEVCVEWLLNGEGYCVKVYTW